MLQQNNYKSLLFVDLKKNCIYIYHNIQKEEQNQRSIILIDEFVYEEDSFDSRVSI